MTKENHSSADTNPDTLTGEPSASHAVDLLNELLETTRDAEFGFQACADEVAAANLQQVFYLRAEQCHQAADELVQLIWRFGGTPAEGGAATGAMHRGWGHIKGAAGADSDLSMLEECQRREAAAVARYRKALAQNLPSEVCSFLERQAQRAQRNHDQIRDLRNEASARG